MSIWTVTAQLLEELVEDLYTSAGFDTCEPVSPVRIANAILGVGSVQIVPRHALRFASAVLVPIRGRYRIYVSSSVPRAEVGHHVGHELGHFALRRAGMHEPSGEGLERVADYIGAALVAPLRAFRRAVETLGENVHALRRAFATSHAVVAIRLALMDRNLDRVRAQQLITMAQVAGL